MSMARSIQCVVGNNNAAQQQVTADGAMEMVTYKELMQYTILYMIQNIEKNNPFMLDNMAYIAYSSDIAVVVPFTKTMATLKQAVIEATLRDTTNLADALVHAIDLVHARFGEGHAVEFIVFTDACDALDDPRISAVRIPFIHHLHFVSICSTTAHAPHKPAYASLGNNLRATLHVIKQTATSINVKNELLAIVNNIISKHYTLYKGLLAYGHLSSPFTLYPGIGTIFSFMKDRVDAGDTFPIALAVIGFLPVRPIMEIPSASRHVVIPLIPDQSPTTPPLCPVLHHTLRIGKKAALVSIAPKWYGMLTSAVESDTSVLTLSIFHPDIDLSSTSLGIDLSSLEVGPPQAVVTEDPSTSHILSYNALSKEMQLTMMLAKPDALQSDFSKILPCRELGSRGPGRLRSICNSLWGGSMGQACNSVVNAYYTKGIQSVTSQCLSFCNQLNKTYQQAEADAKKKWG
eukprot:gene15032-17782_t